MIICSYPLNLKVGNLEMRKQKVWHSIEEIFTALNNCGCNYIVMRNFECLMLGQAFVNGHDDIDLLCENPQKVFNILHTF